MKSKYDDLTEKVKQMGFKSLDQYFMKKWFFDIRVLAKELKFNEKTLATYHREYVLRVRETEKNSSILKGE